MSQIDNLRTFFTNPQLGGAYEAVLCGQNSCLWWAVIEGHRERQTELLDIFRNEKLKRRLNAPGVEDTDPKILHRLEGFAAVLSGATSRDFTDAVKAFKAARAPELGESTTVSVDDKRKDALKDTLGFLPSLDSEEGWIAYDMLWHIQCKIQEAILNSGKKLEIPIPPPIDREVMPVLLDDGGKGNVVKFVLEELPGPDGLVTPDWWSMGMIHFPGKRDDGKRSRDSFVASTQSLLRKLLRERKNRFRWRLEPLRKPLPVCAFGRSGEAAVTCAALALCAEHRVPNAAILNPRSGITATVEASHLPPSKWALGTVEPTSITNKLNGAKAAGLSKVLLHKDQLPQELPDLVRVQRVATLGDAYFRLKRLNEMLEPYLEHLDGLAAKWDYRTTPT
ncbi:MAG: hypothetical protein KF873_03045 [Gemmataceae bacterium]|nr:hypothetical protein [Gemmataceae bacterium]